MSGQPLGDGKQSASPQPTSARTDARRGVWRPITASILIFVAAVLAPLSVVANWARDHIEDTDRYLETVGPLADDPAIQAAIAARVDQVVFDYLDLDAATKRVTDALAAQNLPPRVETTLRAAAGPLADSIRSFIEGKIRDFVASDAFAEAWVEANRAAHDQLVVALTGNGSDTVSIEGGQVTVQLATVINAVKQQLVDNGIALASRIPTVNAEFTIVQSDDFGKVRGLVDLLDTVATWLPLVALLLLLVAIFIARDRRRAVLGSSLAVALSMIVLGIGLNVGRAVYLDKLPSDVNLAAQEVMFDQIVMFIRTALRAVLVVALTAAIVAWLLAKSGSGARVRQGIVRSVAALRSGTARTGLDTGAFGRFLSEYRSAVRVGVVAVAALIYLQQDHPSGASALVLVLVAVVVLLILEVLAAPEPTPAVGADDRPRESSDD
jgi:hypothetical protein